MHGPTGDRQLWDSCGWADALAKHGKRRGGPHSAAHSAHVHLSSLPCSTGMPSRRSRLRRFPRKTGHTRRNILPTANLCTSCMWFHCSGMGRQSNLRDVVVEEGEWSCKPQPYIAECADKRARACKRVEHATFVQEYSLKTQPG